MSTTGIKKVKDDFTITVGKMLDRSNQSGAFARIYKLYQKFQTERFKTENASEGKRWDSLKSPYKEMKTKKFRIYPGSGNKMMIATGTLAGAVIGPGAPFTGVDKHRAQFLKQKMIISVEESGVNAAGKKFDYAGYADEKRPVMDFSDDHLEAMKEELALFILGG